MIKKYCTLLLTTIFLSQPLSAYANVTEGGENFTTDWFSNNIKQWSKYKPMFDSKPNMRCLEVGSWEGRSAIWAAENFCNGPSSTVDAVDTWEGSVENAKEATKDLYQRFLSNTATLRNANRIVPHVGKSKDVLVDFIAKVKSGAIQKYDFIYIDGSHEAKDVLLDTVLAWELLKVGGIMAFDDYKWGEEGIHSPGIAIDGFLSVYKSTYEVLHKDYQVHIRKLSDTPRK